MHLAGKEIIEEGYLHVVSIYNYMGQGQQFHVPAEAFINSLDYELHESGLDQTKKVWHYKGLKCKWTIIDGELPGLGIYVFFKDAIGKGLVSKFINYFHTQHPRVQ